MTVSSTNTPNLCLQDLNTIMFHREAIKTFPFPFASQCKVVCCYIAILAFTAFTWGKWDRQGILGCLREKPREAPGLLKIVPVYIKEFLFLLFADPSCPEATGSSSAGVTERGIPLEFLGFTSAMCQTCNLAVGRGVYSSPPPAVWNSLIGSPCHTTALLQGCL